LIWVLALVCQSDPAVAIFDPGSACGMPYAPLALAALTRQPLSLVQMLSRQPNSCLALNPNEGSIW